MKYLNLTAKFMKDTQVSDNKDPKSTLVFENTGRRGFGQFKQNPSILSFQHGMLESRFTWMCPDASLRIWMPALHAGMTKICIFMFCEYA